jgi:hypothetical protein
MECGCPQISVIFHMRYDYVILRCHDEINFTYEIHNYVLMIQIWMFLI